MGHPGIMGEVYRAHQLNLKRDVVIKVVSTEWLESCVDNEEELETGLQRFRIEVQAMAQVRHPNIVQIYDYGSLTVQKSGEENRREYIVMEYIPGNTLRETMSEEGFYPEEDLTVEWLLKYFFPILDGVQALHDLGIVHRDLKPENVLMDGNIPKLADFGLARSCRLKSVTQSMDVKGTPPYMSPEHFFEFKNADEQSDVYSLGKMLYEALAGKLTSKMRPFQKESLPDPETAFFQNLDQIIQNCTAEKREDRLESVSQLRKALSDVVNELKKKSVAGSYAKPQRSSFLHNPKWIWAGVALAVVSVGVMALWHIFHQPVDSLLLRKNVPLSTKDISRPNRTESAPVQLKPSETPGQTLLAEDGATLHFVPGGMVTIATATTAASARIKKAVKVNSFYMDETQVTNHQYVEFLNQNLSAVRVERRVVRSDDEIWLLLGEVIEGYNPIIFRDGRFNVTNSAYASYPVLRVTGLGASAYVYFYGRRLPTAVEWLYAVKKGEAGRDNPPPTDDRPSSGMQMGWMMGNWSEQRQSAASKPAPRALKALQKLKPVIRGMNKDIGEWALLQLEATSRDESGDAEYVILGGIEAAAEKDGPIPSLVIRQPWESFEEVGFRSVRSVKIQSAEHE
ncbi:MAG: protein kinase [Deltaproteobacteria bacterium]|nr:protein kinase [Deltaproteobacteria bacterium]